MERYKKSWKAAEEVRNEQISTATTEVRTIEHRADNEIRTPRTRGKRTVTSPSESTPVTRKKIMKKEPNEWQPVQRNRSRKPEVVEKPVARPDKAPIDQSRKHCSLNQLKERVTQTCLEISELRCSQ